MRERVSGGILFIGTKRFLMFLAFLSTSEIFKIASSTYIFNSSSANCRFRNPWRRSNLFGCCDVGPTDNERGRHTVVDT